MYILSACVLDIQTFSGTPKDTFTFSHMAFAMSIMTLAMHGFPSYSTTTIYVCVFYIFASVNVIGLSHVRSKLAFNTPDKVLICCFFV